MVDYALPRIDLPKLRFPDERCASGYPNLCGNDSPSLPEASASGDLWTLLAAIWRTAFSASRERRLRRFQRGRRWTFGRLPVGWRIATRFSKIRFLG
jgi:hypothetical protein